MPNKTHPKKKRPAKKRPAKKPSTALMRRPPQAPARIEVVSATAVEPVRQITDSILLGELGTVELQLTEKEETVLAEPVSPRDICVKPTGQAYLSHPTYTRWLNRAFGRTGWQLVPVSRAMKTGNSITRSYMLFVHKQPVAYADGEQEYFENNRDQTYGDALESTVASALRRVCKRLGIGLEMWDKRFLDDFVAEHAIKVPVLVRAKEGNQWVDKKRYWWRLRTAAPFPREIRGRKTAGAEDVPEDVAEDEQSQPQRRAAPRREPPAASNPKAGEAITEAQLKRLWVIIRRSGRDENEIKRWLKARFQLDSTKTIPRRDYEYVCAAIEGSGELPMRDPGEE